MGRNRERKVVGRQRELSLQRPQEDRPHISRGRRNRWKSGKKDTWGGKNRGLRSCGRGFKISGVRAGVSSPHSEQKETTEVYSREVIHSCFVLGTIPALSPIWLLFSTQIALFKEPVDLWAINAMGLLDCDLVGAPYSTCLLTISSLHTHHWFTSTPKAIPL